MPMTSRDVGTRVDPLETGVLDEAVVARLGVWFVRGLVLALIIYTAFGSFVPLAGGWAALGRAWAAGNYLESVAFRWALGYTLIIQGTLTVGQWGAKTQLVWWWRRWRYYRSKDDREDEEAYALQRVFGWGLLYALLLVASSAPSTYTYTVWAWPLIKDVAIVAGIGIFLASMVGDMIPEWTLVRRPPRAGGGGNDDGEEG